MDKFKIEHEDDLSVPLKSVCIDGEVCTDESELSLLLLVRYGNGPLGAYDVICIYNHANNTYEFLPSHTCSSWVVEGG